MIVKIAFSCVSREGDLPAVFIPECCLCDRQRAFQRVSGASPAGALAPRLLAARSHVRVFHSRSSAEAPPQESETLPVHAPAIVTVWLRAEPELLCLSFPLGSHVSREVLFELGGGGWSPASRVPGFLLTVAPWTHST